MADKKPAPAAPAKPAPAKPAPAAPAKPAAAAPAADLDPFDAMFSNNKSKCLPGDKKCKDKEDAEAAAAALKKKEAEKDIYKPPENLTKIEKSSTGFNCSMDGMVKMVQELTEVSLMLIALGKETIMSMIPKIYAKAVNYAWAGMVGVGNWVGYVAAAGYYVSQELSFGYYYCEAMGYGQVAIGYLYQAVSWANPDKKKNEAQAVADAKGGVVDKMGAAKEAAKAALAAAAKAGAGGAAANLAKAAEAAKQKEAQAAIDKKKAEAVVAKEKADIKK